MSEGELFSHPASEAAAASAPVTDPITPTKIEISAEPAKAETIVEPVIAEAPAESPKVESPAIQPQIEETAQAAPALAIAATVEPAIETIATDPITEQPAIAPKMPPVAQLAAPIAQLVGAPSETAAPPEFLREHATRTIAAKPPLRAEPRPGFRPKPPIAAKPEFKAPPKAESKPEPKAAPRQTRFALLAASIAICAGIGAAAGAAGIVGVSRFTTSTPAGTAADVQTLREQVAQLAADVAATRTNVEHINRNTGAQFGKITERFDRIDHAQTQAQIDPAAKLAKIGETLDKMEKRLAALPTTPAPTAAATPAPAPANDVTGSIAPRPAPEAKAPPKPRILEEFSLQRVYDGVALVESRMGMIELVPGSPMPGGGRVEEIKRQDGRWVVVTSRGLIVSQR